MKRYFLYELKRNIFTILCIALIAVAVYLVEVLATDMEGVSYVNNNIGTVLSMGGGLAVFVPVWVYGYKMKKRSVDLFYALPLKRAEIFAVKTFIGLIAVFLPFTAAYVIGAVATTLKAAAFSTYGMSAVYYVPCYFASAAAMLCIYSVSAFFYTRANRAVDGIVFVVFAMLAAYALVLAISGFTDGVIYADEYVMPSAYSPFSPLIYTEAYFEEALSDNEISKTVIVLSTMQKANIGIGFSLTGLGAIGAGVGAFLGERRAHAENIGQISESVFGYKTMIPFFTVVLLSLCSGLINASLIVLIAIGAYVTTALYRHTFKIGVKQGIILAVSIVAGLIVYFVNTACYGGFA